LALLAEIWVDKVDVGHGCEVGAGHELDDGEGKVSAIALPAPSHEGAPRQSMALFKPRSQVNITFL